MWNRDSRDDSDRLWAELESGLPQEGRPVLDTLVFTPEGPSELAAVVRRQLVEKYGDDNVTVDGDDDIVVRGFGYPVWVRVHQNQPAVQIFARVVRDVHSRRATATELAILNRDSAWCLWKQRGREVWPETMVLGRPFVPRHLDSMLDVFVSAVGEHRHDLAFRVGGKVA